MKKLVENTAKNQSIHQNPEENSSARRGYPQHPKDFLNAVSYKY